MGGGLARGNVVGLHGLLDSGTLSGLNESELLDRYLVSRDERAFELIVTRHAPMVLGVCRRILRDPNDVDDAFQATFLILVRKAGTIRSRDRLNPWLYGVATKVATRARAVASANRRRAGSPTGVEPEAPTDDGSLSELAPIFDEEVARLPEKYRVAVLLCCLEGKGHEEAAAELAWPIGTVRSRLFRGRQLLQSRLRRRGFAPSAWPFTDGLPAISQAEFALIRSTVQVASRFATGKTISTVASASVAALTQGVLTTMIVTKLKIAAVLLFTAAALGSGAVVLAMNPGQEPAVEEKRGANLPNTGGSSRQGLVGSGEQTPLDLAANRSIPANELLVRLKIAQIMFKHDEYMDTKQRGVISKVEMDTDRLKISLVEAQIADERESIANTIELLQLRIDRQKTEYAGMRSAIDGQRLLGAKRKEMVDSKIMSPTELLPLQMKLDSMNSDLELKKIELRETSTRIAQLERKLKRLTVEPSPESTDPSTPASKAAAPSTKP